MHRIEETVARGVCIGCGACAIASGGVIQISLSPQRIYQASLENTDEQQRRAGSRVCPFSDESPNEDELGAPQPDSAIRRHQSLGLYVRTFAGRVSDPDYLRSSSSGGLTSWLLEQLIRRNMVDAVVNVGRPNPGEAELFSYDIDRVPTDPLRRKSQYYATTLAEVLERVLDSDMQFAIVGLPCFIRAARALCAVHPVMADRIKYFVSLVCGHYKTQAYAESLAWQLGISPSELSDVDFRVKTTDDQRASEYNFGAMASGDARWRIAPTKSLLGASWGHNAFQPEACNFCDDVVGETADASFGDAWLPQFEADPRGTNVVVLRNRELAEIFDDAAARAEIWVAHLSPDEVVASQAGGYRHRREGLALRLADDISKGLSVPKKRVEPDPGVVEPRRASLLRQRRRMAADSHVVFARARSQADLRIYTRWIHREIRRYRRIETSFLGRLRDKLARRFGSVFRGD